MQDREIYIGFLGIVMGLMAVVLLSCHGNGKAVERATHRNVALGDTIKRIAADYPGEIGVAVIIDGKDRVSVNDENKYPMMSVFKLHQALAVCHDFDKKGISLDSAMTITRRELNPHTWSPMAKEHTEQEFILPVRELLRYTLISSDNNASNLMFRRLVGREVADGYIATLIPRNSFRIEYTEEEMSADHARAYVNSSSPLGAALLMERLFADSLVSREKQDFIKRALGECRTGNDRIAAPLLHKPGVKIAHKTGSGYSEGGVLAAHNDVAYVSLPDGHHYTLAVFVKDFKGDETAAAEAIARISATVYDHITTGPSK